MPKVSVIMAAYNTASTIRKAIGSVQNQTMQDVEIVVVDDGSTDGTHELVDTLAAKDPRIKSMRLPVNSGVGAARNTAIGDAAGEWVTILDADDWYEPSRLEVMLNAARDFHADVVADNLRIFDHMAEDIVDRTTHGRKNRVMELTAEILFRKDNPLRLHSMGFLQPMFRRQFLLDHRLSYNQGYRVGEDFLLLAEVLLHGARAVIVPGAYYVYVHHISPTTRVRSPHSRSPDGFMPIFRTCDEILRKYGATMPPGAHRALKRRRWLFEKAIAYQDARDALRRGDILAVLGRFAVRPYLVFFVTRIIARWIDAHLRLRLRLYGKWG